MMSEAEALCRIKSILDDRDKVILFNCMDKELLRLIRNELKKRNSINTNIWQSIENTSDYISQSKMDEVIEMYQTYDFSNKVSVISESNQCGSILNYVKNGILTEEEMIEVILY